MYKRQVMRTRRDAIKTLDAFALKQLAAAKPGGANAPHITCLLYTSDAADERSSVDLGGRRIIKKKKIVDTTRVQMPTNNNINTT